MKIGIGIGVSYRTGLSVFLTQNLEVAATETTVDLSFETSKPSGTFYYVAVATGATEPSYAQIIAGTDGDDNASDLSGSVAVGSIDTAFSITNTLAAGDFVMWAFQESGGQNSAKHSAAFSVPIASAATDGTAGSLEASNGTVLTEGVADYTGDLDAVRMTDSNPGTTGVVQSQVNVTFADGSNSISVKFEKVSGDADALQIQLGNVTTGYTEQVDFATGVISETNAFPTSSVTDLGGGWWQYDATFDTTGWGDRTGVLRFNLRQGGSPNLLRDGTQSVDLNDIYIIGG